MNQDFKNVLMAYSCYVWQKTTEVCKANILQLKKWSGKKTILKPYNSLGCWCWLMIDAWLNLWQLYLNVTFNWLCKALFGAKKMLFSFYFFLVVFCSSSEPCSSSQPSFSELLLHHVYVWTKSTSMTGFIVGFLTTAICIHFSSFPPKCLFKSEQKRSSVI